MPVTVVNIELKSGSVIGETREELASAIKALPDGFAKVTIQTVKRGYTSTRYKYYFGHVLPVILSTCGHFFKVLDGDTVRPARSTDEIHEVFKLKYNPTMIQTPFGIYVAANTTTSLCDRDFINRFEEAIIIEFSEPPYGCDFMGREEYAEFMKHR